MIHVNYMGIWRQEQVISSILLTFSQSFVHFQIYLVRVQAFPNFTSFILSEFEELEAVPTLAVMDGPLEPTSSTTANATDASDDPSFINFFSVRFRYVSKFLNFAEFLV